MFQEISKIDYYETLYIVQRSRNVVETGSKKASKDICKARINGTWKAKNVDTLVLLPKRLIGNVKNNKIVKINDENNRNKYYIIIDKIFIIGYSQNITSMKRR